MRSLNIILTQRRDGLGSPISPSAWIAFLLMNGSPLSSVASSISGSTASLAFIAPSALMASMRV